MGSPGIEARHLRTGGEALLEKQRRSEVSCPQGVAAVAVVAAERRRLAGGVDGEPPGALQPHLVSGAREELEEREPVAGGPVAQSRALAERAGRPGQLAAREQQRVQDVG